MRGIWFDAAEGEIVGLVGPDGAGKSTTLGVLTTVVRPNRGRAWVAGHDVRLDPQQVRRAIGVVFQDSVLDDAFTARENLRLHARLWGLRRDDHEQRIAALLDALDLTGRADDLVRTFGVGMRRRLELARAVLARPKVLFLDEPTAGVDPIIRDTIWLLVERLRRQDGMTVVLATRDLDEAAAVCDRLVVMERGRIVGDGRPHDRAVPDGDPVGERVPAARMVTR